MVTAGDPAAGEVGAQGEDALAGAIEAGLRCLAGDAKEFGDQGHAAAVDEESGDCEFRGGEHAQDFNSVLSLDDAIEDQGLVVVGLAGGRYAGVDGGAGGENFKVPSVSVNQSMS